MTKELVSSSAANKALLNMFIAAELRYPVRQCAGARSVRRWEKTCGSVGTQLPSALLLYPVAIGILVVCVTLTRIARIREIYKGKGLEIPDDFDSTLTMPPVHFMQ